VDFPDLYEIYLVKNGNDYEVQGKEDTFKNPLLISIFCIGCIIGTLVVPTICDFFGRKRSILFGAAIFGFGSLFAGIISNLALFYASRTFIGIGIGILSTICPVYIAETAPAKIRGKLITMYQFMITIGILLAYIMKFIIEFFLKNDPKIQWRVILGNQVIPGFLLLIMMFFLPYSPRYYIWQERDDEALRIVSKLRGISTTRDLKTQTEFQNMKRSLEIEKHEHSTGWKEVFKGPMIKRVILVMGLQIFQQFSGINFMLNNHKDIIEEIFRNGEETSKVDVGIYLGFLNIGINVIGTLPAFYLIEKFGRKYLLIIGSIGMSVSLSMSSFADYWTSKNKNENNNNKQNPYMYISIIGIALFIFFFACSWGPVVWVYQSECFPMRVRSKATALCSFANWTSFAIIATLYPILVNSGVDKKEFNVYIANAFFAGCCILSLFYVIFFVKETKGVVLEDMDSVFIKNTEKSKQK